MKPLIAITVLLLAAPMPGRAQFQPPRVVVSYNALTPYGRNNRDSVDEALRRLGIPFDSIDRNWNDTLDYTPWQILVWSSGDPNVPVIAGEARSQAGLSTKEIGEVEQFLNAGTSQCQKKMVIAGQNIASEHGSLLPNGPGLDTTFLQDWLHVKYLANAPEHGNYQGWIMGEQPAYWKFPDSISSASPDVIQPALNTPLVGPEVDGLTYSYSSHPTTPLDSGAGVSYYNPSINTVFYAFDWADVTQTYPEGNGDATSGTTRVLGAAFAFFRSHGGGLPCPVSVVEQSPKLLLDIVGIYPNPAQTQAEIRFTSPPAGPTIMRLIDPLGKTIREEVGHEVFEGSRTILLDLRGIPDGIYLCEIKTEFENGSSAIASRILSVSH